MSEIRLNRLISPNLFSLTFHHSSSSPSPPAGFARLLRWGVSAALQRVCNGRYAPRHYVASPLHSSERSDLLTRVWLGSVPASEVQFPWLRHSNITSSADPPNPLPTAPSGLETRKLVSRGWLRQVLRTPSRDPSTGPTGPRHRITPSSHWFASLHQCSSVGGVHSCPSPYPFDWLNGLRPTSLIGSGDVHSFTCSESVVYSRVSCSSLAYSLVLNGASLLNHPLKLDHSMKHALRVV